MWGKSECMVDDVYEVNEAFWNAKEILGECKTKIKTIWRIVNLYLLFIFVLLFSKYKEKKMFHWIEWYNETMDTKYQIIIHNWS